MSFFDPFMVGVEQINEELFKIIVEIEIPVPIVGKGKITYVDKTYVFVLNGLGLLKAYKSEKEIKKLSVVSLNRMIYLLNNLEICTFKEIPLTVNSLQALKYEVKNIDVNSLQFVKYQIESVNLHKLNVKDLAKYLELVNLLNQLDFGES